MERKMPDVDIPVDFLVGEVGKDIPEGILTLYRYPCRLQAAIFVLFLEGEIEATINLNRYHIRKGGFITLAPGSIIQFHNQKGSIRAWFVGFSSGFTSGVNLISPSMNAMTSFTSIFESPVIEMQGETEGVYRDFFALLSRSFASGMLQNPEMLKHILNSLLCGIGDLYHKQERSDKPLSRGEELSKNFVQLAMRYYNVERNVSYYADQLRITPQHLSATVKKVTGSNIMDILSKMVVMDAKAQLKSTTQTIQEISYSLNFPNVSFFGKYFKRYVGMSPNEYRKSQF